MLTFGSDFEVDAWSRFCRWNLTNICVWTCDMTHTLVSWTQPSSVVPLTMFFNTSLWHQDRHLKRLNSHEKESTNQNHRLKSLNLKSSICRTDLPPDVFSLKFPFRISGFQIWFFLMHFLDLQKKMFTNIPMKVWKVQFLCLKLKH